jgi:hypothetical protein
LRPQGPRLSTGQLVFTDATGEVIVLSLAEVEREAAEIRARDQVVRWA